MKNIKIIKNRSDIGAGTRGADLGIDAMEIAVLMLKMIFLAKIHLLMFLHIMNLFTTRLKQLQLKE